MKEECSRPLILPIKGLIQRNEKIDTFDLSGIIENRILSEIE